MTTPLGLKEAIEYVLEPILRLDPFPDDDAELMDLFRYTPVEVEGEALVNLFIACSKYYLSIPSDPEHERLCMAVVEAAIDYTVPVYSDDKLQHQMDCWCNFIQAVEALKAYREKKGGE